MTKQIVHIILMVILAAVGLLLLHLAPLDTVIWCAAWQFVLNYCEI